MVTGWRLFIASWLLLTFLCGTAGRTAAPVTPGADGVAAAMTSPLPAPTQLGGTAALPDALFTGDGARATSGRRAAERVPLAGSAAITRPRATGAARAYLHYRAALARARASIPTTFGTPPPFAFPV